MRTNSTREQGSDRPTAMLLPAIQIETRRSSRNHSASSEIFTTLNHEDLRSPDGNKLVETWLTVQAAPKKTVQFAQNTFDQQGDPHVHSPSTSNIDESTTRTDRRVQRFELPVLPSPRAGDHSASIAEAKLYRSTMRQPPSISSSISSVTTPKRQSSLLAPPTFVPHARHAILVSPSISSASLIKDHPSIFSSLELEPSLSPFNQKQFENMRQHVPDQFEEHLPTFFRLGLVLWPKRLFDHSQDLTVKEEEQRQRLLYIMRKDRESTERQRSLTRLYGSVLPYDNLLHKYHFLRDDLSLQGQMALLGAYRDEIENELTKKIGLWKGDPMRIFGPAFSDETLQSSLSSNASVSSPTKVTSMATTTTRSPTMHLHQTKPILTTPRLTHDEIFALTLPERLDQKWREKFLGKIIEQGMSILDQVRKLTQLTSTQQPINDELHAQEVVQAFKRWSYLCSTFYPENDLNS